MKLIFHLQEAKTKEFSINKNTVIIGRGNTCDVVLPFEGFSRRHAQIDLVDGEIFVTDLGSTNGVYIDGERIPVSTKTPMQSFLNLQIGPAHQIEIIDEEQVAGSAANSSSSESTSSRPGPLDTSEHTRTTRMDPRLLKKPAEIKAQIKTKTASAPAPAAEKRKLPTFLIPVLVLAAGIFYYMNRSEEVAPETAAAGAVETNAVPLTDTKFLSQSMLDSLDKNKSCTPDRAQWCQDAAILDGQKEGVVIEGKNLIIYMNMTSMNETKLNEKLLGLGEKEKLEILLLKRIFHTVLIRSLSRQTQFDNVQVVGGLEEQGVWKLKVAVKIKRDIDLKKTDKFYMYEIFDLILNQGMVEKLPEIASLYEKLPLE